MEVLIQQRQEQWNKRFKKCMKDGGYTQHSLSIALNRKYGTQFTQKTISRWVNIGDSKDGIKGFPGIENMMIIADFFKVDIGYLIGETNYTSFLIEDACSFLALNEEAIHSIKEITKPNNSGEITKDMRTTFNNLLNAKSFSNLFESLYDLFVSNYLLQSKKSIKFDHINEGIEYMRNLEYSIKVDKYELNQALILLIKEIFPNL